MRYFRNFVACFLACIIFISAFFNRYKNASAVFTADAFFIFVNRDLLFSFIFAFFKIEIYPSITASYNS